MATTWTVTNRKDGIMELIPPVLQLLNFQPGAGLNSYAGNFRAVRCTLTAAGTYTTGGDALPDVGLRQIDAMLVLADNRTPGAAPGIPALAAGASGAAPKVKLFALAGTELAAAAATTGAYEVLLIGRW